MSDLEGMMHFLSARDFCSQEKWEVLNLGSRLCSLLQHPSSHKRQLGFRKIVYYCVNLIILTLKANLLNEVCFCDGFMCLL